jgi:hypothetical protein
MARGCRGDAAAPQASCHGAGEATSVAWNDEPSRNGERITYLREVW